MNENEIDNMQYSFSENISKIEVKVDSNKDNSKDLISPLKIIIFKMTKKSINQ